MLVDWSDQRQVANSTSWRAKQHLNNQRVRFLCWQPARGHRRAQVSRVSLQTECCRLRCCAAISAELVLFKHLEPPRSSTTS